jgi:hypothetical protein
MHLITLVEISAIWAKHGQAIATSRGGFPSTALNDYWIASRIRSDTWHETLYLYEAALSGTGTSRRMRLWREIEPFMQEILVSEVLTRVLTSVASMLELQNADEDAGPVTTSVFISHVEARHRCLKLLARGANMPVEQATRLNKIRVHMERWTDFFLAQLGNFQATESCCFDRNRLIEFTSEHRMYPEALVCEKIALMQASLLSWLEKTIRVREASPRMNERISKSAMAMLRPEWFDSFGCLKSLSTNRMSQLIEETDGMVESLLSAEIPPASLLDMHNDLRDFRSTRRPD